MFRALLHSANADLHSSSAKFSLGLPTNAVRLRSCNRAVADPRFHDFRQVTVKNTEGGEPPSGVSEAYGEGAGGGQE